MVDECRSAFGYRLRLDGPVRPNHHISDNPKNTYSALRYTQGDLGQLLYSEFADVSDPLAWRFAPDRINFYELYNMSNDLLKNIYRTAPSMLTTELHRRLHAAIGCAGTNSCTGALQARGI